MRYAAMWPLYAKWWDKMTIKPNRVAEFDGIARKIIANKARYQEIEAKTGVPWALIAVLHMRESSGNFNTYLGNGQSLSRVTTIVPAGRGPFKGPNAFFDGAVDALRIDGLSSVRDWRLGKQLFYCEQFNGWGYAPKPSPYIWGGTNVQVRGKWVRDHVFDPTFWDTQPGCAPILATMAKHDPGLQFIRES